MQLRDAQRYQTTTPKPDASRVCIRDLRYCYNATTKRLEFLRTQATNCFTGSATTSFGFDVQGNLAWKNQQNFTFGHDNRLREAVGMATYRYDALGRRVSANNPTAGGNIISMYSQDGLLRRTTDGRRSKVAHYMYLGTSLVAIREQDFSGNLLGIKYQHTDALGTPVAVTDAATNVIERSEYEPYGKLLNRPIADGPGFTGHVQDADSGLTYMQQRYFDPIGLFLSVDPVTAHKNPGQNFNRYWYGNNNPYRFVDPDGRKTGDLFGEIELDLGPEYVGRLDRVPNSDIFEIHVYERGQALNDAVGDRDTKGLRKQEVGVVGPDGNWVNKHGHTKAPTISLTANNRLRSAVTTEARQRGWLGKRGTADIKGPNLARQIQAGLQRTGSLQYLKMLGKSLGSAAVVSGYLDNLSIERACAMDPNFDGC